ncbi:hypothetical protein LZ31DRAFT_103455 [Colletotrichum somersetense]|nr:hypothetical protein LZ31DRAFT_103455 [Colletotrichum somersetense]
MRRMAGTRGTPTKWTWPWSSSVLSRRVLHQLSAQSEGSPLMWWAGLWGGRPLDLPSLDEVRCRRGRKQEEWAITRTKCHPLPPLPWQPSGSVSLVDSHSFSCFNNPSPSCRLSLTTSVSSSLPSLFRTQVPPFFMPIFPALPSLA